MMLFDKPQEFIKHVDKSKLFVLGKSVCGTTKCNKPCSIKFTNLETAVSFFFNNIEAKADVGMNSKRRF